jgi:DNA polymerase-3 subunit alpha
MKTYTPLNVHTHLSFLQALSKPKQLAAQLANYDIKSAVISDFDLLSGCVEFFEECKKNDIKPLLGLKMYVRGRGYVTLISQNKAGWKELMTLSSVSFNREHFTEDKPAISLSELFNTKDILVLSGARNSYLNDMNRTHIEELKANLKDRYFYQVEILKDSEQPTNEISICNQLGIKCVAAPRVLYVNKEDAIDNTLLLAAHMSTTMKELPKKVVGTQYHEILENDFSLRKYDDLNNQYSEELLQNTNLIADMCDEYTILNKPQLPVFPVPNGSIDIEFLRELCRDGWKKKIAGKIAVEKTQEYVDRIKYELDVVSGADLSSYFLIVQDYVNYMKHRGRLVGPGRGSAAGCLISHLVNITNCDPIPYGLMFERFYNAGRNTKDKIALPDVDVDFPVKYRHEVFEYIRAKYGIAHVAQVVTFSRMQGRGAFKEVVRLHGACNHYEADNISNNIPQGESISDKLEEEGETSILRWTLNNDPKALEQWCTLNNGVYSGDYAQYFEQAIRIEGTYKSYGKHASALVVSGSVLSDIVPMMREKSSDELMVSFEYEMADKAGAPKFDILGVNCFDKLMDINSLLRFGEIR